MYARYIPPAKPAATPKATATPQHPAPSPKPAATPQAVGAPGFSYARYVPGAKASPKPPVTPAVQYFDDEEPTPSSAKRKRNIDEEEQARSATKKSKKTQKDKKTQEGVSHDNSSTDNEDAVRAQSEDKGGRKAKVKSGKKNKKHEDRDKDDELVDQTPLPNGDGVAAENGGTDAGLAKSKKVRKGKKGEKSDDRTKHQDVEQDEVMEDPSEPVVPDEDQSMVDAPDGTAEPTPSKKEKRKKEKKKKPGVEEEEAPDEVDKRHKTVLERKTKSLKLADKIAATAVSESEDEPEEVHDLEPLPQPRLVTAETPNPTYETLPAWLADPIRVAQDTRTPFAELGYPRRKFHIQRWAG
jgi:ATP-dependent RNA helicase DDX51/DBP6